MQLVEEVRSDLDTPQNWAPLRPTDNLAAMSLGNGDIIVSQEVLPPHAPPPPRQPAWEHGVMLCSCCHRGGAAAGPQHRHSG